MYANSTIYQKGLVREYKDKYCSNGNSCRFFSKPLKNAAVDNSQIIKFFEVYIFKNENIYKNKIIYIYELLINKNYLFFIF